MLLVIFEKLRDRLGGGGIDRASILTNSEGLIGMFSVLGGIISSLGIGQVFGVLGGRVALYLPLARTGPMIVCVYFLTQAIDVLRGTSMQRLFDATRRLFVFSCFRYP